LRLFVVGKYDVPATMKHADDGYDVILHPDGDGGAIAIADQTGHAASQLVPVASHWQRTDQPGR